MQSPIANDCREVKIDGYTEQQLVPKMLLQVSVRELHNNLVSATNDGGLEEERDEDDNIIISDYTLRSLLSPQFKKIRQDKRSCVVVNVAYMPKVYIHNYYHGIIFIKKNSRISSKILKTEGLGKKKITYMKIIEIQSCHMGIIFTPKHTTWKSQQCVHTHSQIMRYHTVNVYCDVVPNVKALIFLISKQMISIQTPVLQLVFTFII